MAREQPRLILQALRLWDVGLTTLAFGIAYLFRKLLLPPMFNELRTGPDYGHLLLMIIIIWYVSFSLIYPYSTQTERTYAQIFASVIKAACTGMLVLIVCMYALRIIHISRVMMGLFFLLDIGLIAFSKWLGFKIRDRHRQKGLNLRNILIVGSKRRAQDLLSAIGSDPGSGYRVSGCLELAREDVGKEVDGGAKVIGTLDDMREILLEQVVDEIIFAIPLRLVEKHDHYIAVAREIGVPVRILPDWQIHEALARSGYASLEFEEFLGAPTLAFHTTRLRSEDLFIKSVADYIIAGIALALFFPLLILIGCAIRLTSKGPVFYTQARCGLNGREFTLYKFRTMFVDADTRRHELRNENEADGPVFKIRRDPRIVPVLGTFLRRTGLDELPQLINVLKGEMSLIGPRPPIPEEVRQYSPWQRRRLSMRPGLTCIWQSAPRRNELPFDQWMKMDLDYIDNWSLWLDFKIAWKTVRAVLRGGGM